MQPDLTCHRCEAIVPHSVYSDTGGLCRKCQKTIPARVDLRDLIACMRGNDKRYRGRYFDRFSKLKPTVEALPILREAVLQVDDYYLVKSAAASIRKLGAKAAAAIDDLLTAAAHTDPMGMPQCYEDCLATLVAIDKSHPRLVPLIRQFAHLDNWVPISASLKALAEIGTPEAIELLKTVHARWYPKLDKAQKRVADKILAEVSA